MLQTDISAIEGKKGILLFNKAGRQKEDSSKRKWFVFGEGGQDRREERKHQEAEILDIAFWEKAEAGEGKIRNHIQTENG